MIPSYKDLKPIEITHPEATDQPFLPYSRDEHLARPWAIPGTPGLMHRVGGLEKQDGSGNVSYDPDNHQHMIDTRAAKVANAAKFIDPVEVDGELEGTLVLSWGGTYGACRTAVHTCRDAGKKVAHVHLRWLNPFPANLGDVLRSFDKVLIPELNTGQLRMLIREDYLIDAEGLNKVKGKPFGVSEIVEKLNTIS